MAAWSFIGSRGKYKRCPRGAPPPPPPRPAPPQFGAGGPLAPGGPQNAPHALDVLALAEAARDHDSDFGIRNVDPLVQDARRDERAQRSAPESLEDRAPPPPPAVAGE